MTPEIPSKREDPPFPLLERVTATVLLAVVLALGWIVVAAYAPQWDRWLPIEVEVLVLLGLLIVALGLVGVVALLHTRTNQT